jgi:hypothetical protein
MMGWEQIVVTQDKMCTDYKLEQVLSFILQRLTQPFENDLGPSPEPFGSIHPTSLIASLLGWIRMERVKFMREE